jgi:hypothetical protein
MEGEGLLGRGREGIRGVYQVSWLPAAQLVGQEEWQRGGACRGGKAGNLAGVAGTWYSSVPIVLCGVVNSGTEQVQWHAGTGSAFTRSRLHICSGPVHAARALELTSASPAKVDMLELSQFPTRALYLQQHNCLLALRHTPLKEPQHCIPSKPLLPTNYRDNHQGRSFPIFTTCNATLTRPPCPPPTRPPSSKSPSRSHLRKNLKRRRLNRPRPMAAVHKETALLWLSPSSRLRSSLPTCRPTPTTRSTLSSHSRSLICKSHALVHHLS